MYLLVSPAPWCHANSMIVRIPGLVYKYIIFSGFFIDRKMKKADSAKEIGLIDRYVVSFRPELCRADSFNRANLGATAAVYTCFRIDKIDITGSYRFGWAFIRAGSAGNAAVVDFVRHSSNYYVVV